MARKKILPNIGMATTETFNHVIIEIRNRYEDATWYLVLISVLTLLLSVLCGIWCLIAAKNVKQDGKFNFTDDEDSKGSKGSRSTAGSDFSVVEVEQESVEKSGGLKNYFTGDENLKTQNTLYDCRHFMIFLWTKQMYLNPDNSTQLFKVGKISIENHTYNELWSSILITFFIICILVSCGSWCIYAAGKISEEANVYHFENEFKPDNEESKSKFKRKTAGACEVQIEYETNQSQLENWLAIMTKSFMVWKE